jgi:hypothetical protein
MEHAPYKSPSSSSSAAEKDPYMQAYITARMKNQVKTLTDTHPHPPIHTHTPHMTRQMAITIPGNGCPLQLLH